jgi:hypothetical protein
MLQAALDLRHTAEDGRAGIGVGGGRGLGVALPPGISARTSFH